MKYLWGIVQNGGCPVVCERSGKMIRQFSVLSSPILIFLCGIAVVEALCCKLEGRRFQTLWSEWIFPIYLILPAALGPGVYLASNRNEYQKQKNNVFFRIRARPVSRANNLTAINISQPYRPLQLVTGTALLLVSVEVGTYFACYIRIPLLSIGSRTWKQ
jgi:hypothetical protein